MKENTHPCPSPFLNYSVCSVVSLEPPHWSPKNNLFYVTYHLKLVVGTHKLHGFTEGEKRKGSGRGS